MIDVALSVIILGPVAIALLVDVGAVIGWLRGRK
jgi:hypothetical protein